EQLIRDLYEKAFDRVRSEPKTLLIDDGMVAIEADFVGTHIGEFEGVQATGRPVRIPYSAIHDLRGDQISKLRIYFPTKRLHEKDKEDDVSHESKDVYQWLKTQVPWKENHTNMMRQVMWNYMDALTKRAYFSS